MQLIDPAKFCSALDRSGFGFFTGVPDSLLKDFLLHVRNSYPAEMHVITANEGNAVALASGHYLATGKPGIVYMQNSGLGNAVNPLLSLADRLVYSIPMLLIIGWRGEPSGKKDEPQHAKQGQVTLALLDAMGIEFELLNSNTNNFDQIVMKLTSKMKKTSSPVALVVSAGTFGSFLPNAQPDSSYEMSREDAIKQIIGKVSPDDLIVSTTGMASRELFECRDRLGHGHEADFLTVGSMGHCSQIALGIALKTPNRRVICIDGDGAALMHMGAIPVIGQSKPANFLHIVINNGAHDSVGGQPTAGRHLDFSNIAIASGYITADSVHSRDQLNKLVEVMRSTNGPSFIEVKVRSGSRSDLGRPKTSPIQNKIAFMENLHR